MVASEFVSELRQRYGIEFHDLSLLDEAFTHSSYCLLYTSDAADE